MNRKTDIVWINNLKAISTVAVIVLHCTVSYAAEFNLHPGSKSWWIIGNIIDSMVRFCVPVFVMVSGALWLSSNHSMATFYKKRIFRLICPFIFWSLAHYFFNMIYMQSISRNVHIFLDFYQYFRLNEVSAHFWYAYMIIGLFLIAPVFTGWLKVATNRDIVLFLIVWLVILFLQYRFLNSFIINIDLHYFVGFIGYLVLGYYLAFRVKGPEKIQKATGVLLFTIGVLFTVIATHIITFKKRHFDEVFYGYLTLNVFVAAVGVFMWVKNVRVKSNLYAGIINSISKYGYGIYLSHVLVMSLFTKFYWPNNFHPLVFVPVLSLATFSLSWIMIYLLNRIPYAHYIVG